jgi:hypothetical protein
MVQGRAWRWSVLLGVLASAAAEGAGAPPPGQVADSGQGPRVAVTPARSSLRLGTDAGTELAIDLTGADAGRYRPLRAVASVGTIEPLRSRGPGHYVAQYLAPAGLAPQVAVIAVELGNGGQRVHGWTRVLLEGSTVFPFRTNGGASVTMRVAGQLFGPVVADKQGHVEIPIVVPPGTAKAQARAVDRSGESRDTEVDLHLPPFPRVVLLAPDAVEVGSLSEVAVLAVDERGAPQAAGEISLVPSAGLTHPLGGEPGDARFLFEAPTRAESPALTLTASAAGNVPARADASIGLYPTAPDRIDVDVGADRLIVGEPGPVPVTISARDRYGNRTALGAATVVVDGRPQPIAVNPGGTASFGLTAPARYDGRDRLEIVVQVGTARATRSLRVTGGAPVGLTIQVAPGRVVADGHRGTELKVQAIDRNGTPTSVPGLSWETPEGRIRGVRVPHDGEYLAEYVPDRTREAHRELVAVMASESVRAQTLVDVAPPPIKLLAAARAGVATSFGPSVGPAVFLEALAPLRLARVRLFAGVAAGYLRGDVTGRGVQGSGSSHLETNQMPILGVGRAGVGWDSGFELAAELSAGWSWALVRITTNLGGMSAADVGTASAPALGSGVQLTYPLRPGRLAMGLRYLWIDLGQTSLGDRLDGNSAGMLADLGYEMPF